jgi:hypothetical protein
MSFYNENPYINDEFDENFLRYYEAEVLNQITEHSRQIRTLLKLKSATIRYFYNTNTETLEYLQNSNFFDNKNKFELLALQFIMVIKKVKSITGVLEEGIQIIQNNAISHSKNTKADLKELKSITDKLFINIHYLSEQDIYKFPRLLKEVIKIAQNACLVQKCLKKRFSEFFQELGKNYFNLEKELLVMIPNDITQKDIIKDKLNGDMLL